MANDITGIAEVERLFELVGAAPAKVLTKATRAGASIALKYAKAHVYDGYDQQTGTIKKSLKIKKERRKQGKSVYTVGPDASGWYAHFLDYGHWATGGVKLERGKGVLNRLLRDSQTTGMTWVPGNRFLRDSVDKNDEVIKQTILTGLATELDKLR